MAILLAAFLSFQAAHVVPAFSLTHYVIIFFLFYFRKRILDSVITLFNRITKNDASQLRTPNNKDSSPQNNTSTDLNATTQNQQNKTNFKEDSVGIIRPLPKPPSVAVRAFKTLLYLSFSITLIVVLAFYLIFNQTRLQSMAKKLIFTVSGYHSQIDGTIHIHVFPNLSLQLNKITLLNKHPDQTAAPYALNIGRLDASIQLTALLKGKFKPNHFTLTNTTVYLQHNITLRQKKTWRKHLKVQAANRHYRASDTADQFNPIYDITFPISIKNFNIYMIDTKGKRHFSIRHATLELTPNSKKNRLKINTHFNLTNNKPKLDISANLQSEVDINPQRTQIHPHYVHLTGKINSFFSLLQEPLRFNLNTRFIATDKNIQHYTLHRFKLNFNPTAQPIIIKKDAPYYFSPRAESNRQRYPLSPNALTVIDLKTNFASTKAHGYLRFTQQKNNVLFLKLTFDQLNINKLKTQLTSHFSKLTLPPIPTTKNIKKWLSHNSWNINLLFNRIAYNHTTFNKISFLCTHKPTRGLLATLSGQADNGSLKSILKVDVKDQLIDSYLNFKSQQFLIQTLLPQHTLTGKMDAALTLQSQSTSFSDFFATTKGSGNITIENGTIPFNSTLYKRLAPPQQQKSNNTISFNLLSSHFHIKSNTLIARQTLTHSQQQKPNDHWQLTWPLQPK